MITRGHVAIVAAVLLGATTASADVSHLPAHGLDIEAPAGWYVSQDGEFEVISKDDDHAVAIQIGMSSCAENQASLGAGGNITWSSSERADWYPVIGRSGDTDVLCVELAASGLLMFVAAPSGAPYDVETAGIVTAIHDAFLAEYGEPQYITFPVAAAGKVVSADSTYRWKARASTSVEWMISTAPPSTHAPLEVWIARTTCIVDAGAIAAQGTWKVVRTTEGGPPIETFACGADADFNNYEVRVVSMSPLSAAELSIVDSIYDGLLDSRTTTKTIVQGTVDPPVDSGPGIRSSGPAAPPVGMLLAFGVTGLSPRAGDATGYGATAAANFMGVANQDAIASGAYIGGFRFGYAAGGYATDFRAGGGLSVGRKLSVLGLLGFGVDGVGLGGDDDDAIEPPMHVRFGIFAFAEAALTAQLGARGRAMISAGAFARTGVNRRRYAGLLALGHLAVEIGVDDYGDAGQLWFAGIGYALPLSTKR